MPGASANPQMRRCQTRPSSHIIVPRVACENLTGLGAATIFKGETIETPISIAVVKPGRFSPQVERDARIRVAGMQLLERLGVRRRLVACAATSAQHRA